MVLPTAGATEMKPGCDPQAAAEFLRALAHPMRLQILCRLLEGELSVSGFETELGLKQPNLSQQLSALREAQLVTTRREAKSIIYRLNDDRVRIILDALRMTQEATPAAKPAPAVARRIARAAPAPTPVESKAQVAECGVFATAGWHIDASGTRS